MQVKRLHPIFAAEIIGADLSREPDQALVELVETTMKEHVVTCIRGSVITDEQHLRFARAFGPLELPPPSHSNAPRRVAASP